MAQTSKINANGIEIGVIGGTEPDDSYISLTDIAKYKNSEEPRMVITNWMSSYSTIDFLAVWEEIHNSDDFNRLEFQSVRNERGRLIMTTKQWIERMQAKGIISKAGKYGGTYAHSDIALFGKRARDWRKDHPDEAKNGENIRDYASAEELIVLINLENFNAEWISQGLSQQERLQKLRSVAYKQTEILKNNAAKRKLGATNPHLLKDGDKDVD